MSKGLRKVENLSDHVFSTTDLIEVAAKLHGVWRRHANFDIDDTAASAFLLVGSDQSSQRIYELAKSSVERVDAMEQIHFLVRWAQFGMPQFQLTHSLAAKLLLTDCSNVRVEDVKWPFPSFLVSLPHPAGFLRMDDTEGNPVPVRWIAAHKIRRFAHAGLKEFRDRLAADSAAIVGTGGRATWSKGALEKLNDSVCRKHPNSVIKLYTRQGWSTFSSRMIPQEPDAKVSDWLDGPVQHEPSPDDAPENALTERDSNASFVAERLVANLILYLNSDHCRHRRLGESRSGSHVSECVFVPQVAGAQNVWSIGDGVKLPIDMLNAARDSVKKDRTTWRLSSKFVVRGHWRNQAHGQGWSQRTQRWIEPYWKGPEHGAKEVRIYDMDEAKS